MQTPSLAAREAALAAAYLDVSMTTGVDVSALVTIDDVAPLCWVSMLETREARYDERSHKVYLPGYGAYFAQDTMMRLSWRLYATQLHLPDENRLDPATIEHVKQVFRRRFLWNLRGAQATYWCEYAARTAVAVAREVLLPSISANRHDQVLWTVWQGIVQPQAANLLTYLHESEGLPYYLVDAFDDDFMARRWTWTD